MLMFHHLTHFADLKRITFFLYVEIIGCWPTPHQLHVPSVVIKPAFCGFFSSQTASGQTVAKTIHLV
jgi:hypothetical protein